MSYNNKNEFSATPKNPPTQNSVLATTQEASIPETTRAQKAERRRVKALEKTIARKAYIAEREEARKRKDMDKQERIARATHAVRDAEQWQEIRRQQRAGRAAQLNLAFALNLDPNKEMSNEQLEQVVRIAQSQIRERMGAQIRGATGIASVNREEELRRALLAFAESLERTPSTLDIWRAAWAEFDDITDSGIALMMISDIYDRTIQARAHPELSHEIHRCFDQIAPQRGAPSKDIPKGLPRIPHTGQLYGKLLALIRRDADQAKGERPQLNRMCQAIKRGLDEDLPNGEALLRTIDEAGGLVNYVDRNKRSRLEHRLAEAPNALKNAIRSCRLFKASDPEPGNVVLSLHIAGESREISAIIPSKGFETLEEALRMTAFGSRLAQRLRFFASRQYILAVP